MKLATSNISFSIGDIPKFDGSANVGTFDPPVLSSAASAGTRDVRADCGKVGQWHQISPVLTMRGLDSLVELGLNLVEL